MHSHYGGRASTQYTPPSLTFIPPTRMVVYGIISAFFTVLINLTEKGTEALDQCAKDVGLQVSQVEAISPRQDWSTSFQARLPPERTKDTGSATPPRTNSAT